MKKGLYWLAVQLLAIGAGIYIAVAIYDAVST
ncbi:MAG: hypothetical protein QOG54_240 [Actinomycetota bacterium]|jgi:hypothetical protein|nr:hypothetical protein [Actinomycetota bacterium]